MNLWQMRQVAGVVLGALSLSGNQAIAQTTAHVDSVGACDYRLCALTIVPTWNGLRVVRGTSGAAVANLNFFFPRDISHALAPDGQRSSGSDSAVAAAHRAVKLRRIASAFTDVGLLGVAVAGVRSLRAASNKHTNSVVAAAGLASLGLSVPFQFAADGALSQSVWWYNLRYAAKEERTTP
jgi:hypothetical protein